MRIRGWSVSVAMVLALLVGVATLHAQVVDPLPETAYWELVARTREIVELGEDLDAISAEWEAIHTILLADGRMMPIDTSYVTGLLSAEPVDRTAALSALDALTAATSTWRSTPANPTAADSLATILDRSEFDYAVQPPSFWETLGQRVLELLFGSETIGTFARLMSQLWPVIAIAVIVGVAVYIVRSFFNQFAQNVDLSADDPHVPNLTVAGARNRALERATDGDYRDAVRYLYLATLLHLDEQGILDYDRTRTNREYVRSVRTNPAVAADLQAVVHVFDETWYGYHPLSASAYAAYAARINALVDGKRVPVVEGTG
ncbi:MAG: DUF4129 domain-containing protein [Anaerolineae bacterium]|nr:DUF4129 domain-containing protein [Anaerolineae bacterium]